LRHLESTQSNIPSITYYEIVGAVLGEGWRPSSSARWRITAGAGHAVELAAESVLLEDEAELFLAERLHILDERLRRE
jgi:hypothetical protein